MNTRVYYIMLLVLSFTLAHPLTDHSLRTDEDYTGLEKRTLKGKVMADGTHLIRRANNPNHPKKKQKIGHGVLFQNKYLGNALQNQLVDVDPTGIQSSSKVELKSLKRSKDSRGTQEVLPQQKYLKRAESTISRSS
jgi:hypothetical protein